MDFPSSPQEPAPAPAADVAAPPTPVSPSASSGAVFSTPAGHFEPVAAPVQWAVPARLAPVEMDALRARVLGNGALTAVLEAIEDCMMLFSESGQLVHANAEALKTLDQVGVQGAVGLKLHELLGCAVDDVRSTGCITMSRCPNCDSIRMLLSVMEGRPLDSAVSLQIEQSSGLFTGKFDVKSAPVDIDGTRLRLLILRQRTALHRKSAKRG